MNIAPKNEPVLSDTVKEKIIDAMIHTPTGDNCQPFRFKWKADVLVVFYVTSRGKHFFNMSNSATYLSLGCLIEAGKIQASHHGLAVEWDVIKIPAHGTHKIAKINFTSRDVVPDQLKNNIQSRCTDRRVFRPKPMEETHQQKLTHIAKTFEFSHQHLVEKKDHRFVAAICNADKILWTNKSAQNDLLKWIRLTKAELMKKDGMPWRSLGIGQFERLILFLCRKWWVQKLMNLSGGLIVSRQVLKKQIQSSTGLCLISIDKTDADSIVDAGRHSFRVWLQLNNLGYGVQPLSIPPLFSFAKKEGHLPENFPVKHLALVDEVDQEMKRNFNLSSELQPIWMFRFGAVDQIPDSQRTPRLNQADLID